MRLFRPSSSRSPAPTLLRRCSQRGSQVAPPYYCAFSSAQKGACLYGLRTVDQDVRDSLWEVFGILVCCFVNDPLGVEYDQVCGVSGRDQAPLAQLEPPGGKRGHLPDSLLEGEQLFLSHVPGEHVREGAVESGVRFLGLVMKAVRGDERPSPPDHLLHVGACHVEEYDGDFPVLLE